MSIVGHVHSLCSNTVVVDVSTLVDHSMIEKAGVVQTELAENIVVGIREGTDVGYWNS